jgi:hypothetical protein
VFLVFPLVGFHQFGLVCVLCFEVSLVAFGLISWFAWRGSCRLCTELLALFNNDSSDDNTNNDSSDVNDGNSNNDSSDDNDGNSNNDNSGDNAGNSNNDNNNDNEGYKEHKL